MINRDRSFREIELESWTGLAGEYDVLFSSISRQAIDPVLDSLGSLSGRRLLDMASGTGHLVAAAAKRGAISQGIDFAETMVAIARANYPQARFEVSDATRLPYQDNNFDAVSCTFGLSHMENPQAAIAEAFRVLKPGGWFAFTLWYGAQDGNEAQAMMKEALAYYATNPIVLPESWTQFRNADEAVCRTITARVGFESPRFQRIPIILRSETVENVIGLFEKFSIRNKVILDNQPLEVKRRIMEYIRRKAEKFRQNGWITLAWPALLTVVQKSEQTGGIQHVAP
jgi:ubiquinone/menaquinone biosynthesis C-methylase UbiE